MEHKGEVDPFDTTEYEEVVAELKAKEVDPFDTTLCKLGGPSKTELQLLEKEILDPTASGKAGEKSNLDILADLEKDIELEESLDPFDTGFAAAVLPDKGDPFDTTHLTKLVKQGSIDDPDFDPFDTTVADKVIPVRKPKVSQRSTVSIEDDDFDPETTFKVQKKRRPPPPRPAPVDPFSINSNEFESSSPAKILTPLTEVKESTEENWATSQNQELKNLEEEFLGDIGGPLKRSFTDDDFDPRGPETPPAAPEPDEFELEEEEDDPFDTSSVLVA